MRHECDADDRAQRTGPASVGGNERSGQNTPGHDDHPEAEVERVTRSRRRIRQHRQREGQQDTDPDVRRHGRFVDERCDHGREQSRRRDEQQRTGRAGTTREEQQATRAQRQRRRDRSQLGRELVHVDVPNPPSRARTIASPRPATCSLAKIEVRWLLTVLGDRYSSAAMSALRRPWAR